MGLRAESRGHGLHRRLAGQRSRVVGLAQGGGGRLRSHPGHCLGQGVVGRHEAVGGGGDAGGVVADVQGEVVGRGTSGGYGWRCGKSLALGLVRVDLAKIGTELEIEILGKKYQAIVIEESPFDPKNECLRS